MRKVSLCPIQPCWNRLKSYKLEIWQVNSFQLLIPWLNNKKVIILVNLLYYIRKVFQPRRKNCNTTKWPIRAPCPLWPLNPRQKDKTIGKQGDKTRQKNMGPWVAQLKIVIPDWTKIGQNAPMWNAVTWTTAEIDDSCDLILEHIYLLSVQRNT